MCFGHYDPTTFYQNLLTLHYDHGFSIDTVENMYPFELVMYISMLNNRLDEKRRSNLTQKASSGR